MGSAPPDSRTGVRALARAPVGNRIRGIDVARAVAIIGMVMVHIGPIYVEGFGLTGAAYRVPLGRASILFVLIAGVGVSLLAGDRTRARLTATTMRLLWSAAFLLPLGVALQALDTPVAVILQYYAAYFLIALVAIHLSNRAVLLLAAASALVGPSIVIGARQLRPDWFDAGLPVWSDVGRLGRDLVVSGYYPALVWAAPLLVGIWLGRLDLRSRRTAAALVLAGGAVAAGSLIAGNALDAAAGEDVARGSWLALLTNEPHREMPLWVISSVAIGAAILGLCLLLGRIAARATWPLAALGQLALTAYVAHLIVLAVEPGWLRRSDFTEAWLSVGRFAAMAVVAAVAWRIVATRGPIEGLLHLPWWRPRARPALREETVAGATPAGAPGTEARPPFGFAVPADGISASFSRCDRQG